MFLNNLKIAVRGFTKNRLFSFVNFSGLSIGMATAILIFIWVQNEWTFDSYHKDAKDIYRIICHWNGTGETININAIPLKLQERASAEIPEIEEFYVVKPAFNRPMVTTPTGDSFEERELAYINEQWFDGFEYRILNGSPADFYAHRNSLAITKDHAQKFFGEVDPIGQSLEIYGVPRTVRLLLDNNPTNSSFQFKLFLPMAASWNNQEEYETDLSNGNYNYFAFFKGADNLDQTKVSNQLSAILNDMESSEKNSTSLIPLLSMRLDETVFSDYFKHQSRSSVYIFAIIGFIILLTAGLNYINLSTALISKRVKEIGVKKVVGASFQSLFYQMLTETVLLSTMAFVAALGLVQLMLPSLRMFVDIPLALDFTKPTIWLVLIGVMVLSIAIAGVYPALMTANFKPIQLIRGNEKAQKGVTLRKVLVVTQFTSVIIVLISTFVIYQQLQYIQYKDVGYDRSQVMLIRPNLFRVGDGRQNFENYIVFKEELSKLPQFESVAMTDNPISNINNRNSGGFQWEGQAADQSVNVAQFRANEDLQELFGLEMIEGRWFNPELQTDRNNVILNETAIRQFGIKEPAIGTKTTFQQREGTIIGVVKDFNFSSLREKIEPLVIWHNDNRGTNILARVEGENIKEAIQLAESKFEEILPGLQFEYQFIDEAFQKMHTADIKMSQLFRVFTGILVFISCLGLLGLAVFAADRRVKEIGVRKILGASIGHIVGLLSKDFLQLVLIAFVIAVPIGWYFMKGWLSNFAYASPLNWWIFALAGLLAITVAFLTVSTQSIKAAVVNPVQSLRNE